ncbi:MAG: acyltransferase [Planctomycetota bacterium]
MLKYFPALDGLRGLAVLIVLIAHATPVYVSGAAGVDVFFVLSGFLITGILADERARSGGIKLVNFFARRFLRLMPALWLSVCAVALGDWALGRFDTERQIEVFWAVTYCMNWVLAFDAGEPWVMAHTWSLAIEEQFYLIWPFALLAMHKLRLRDGGRAGVLIGLAVACVVYRNAMGFSPQRIYFGLDTHCDGLLLGSAVAYLHRAGLLEARALTRVIRFGTLPALVMLLAMPRFMAWTEPLTALVYFTLVNLFACLLIAAVVTGRGGVLDRVLNLGPLKYLGKISYGLYLYHQPILIALRGFGPLEVWYICAPLGLSASLVFSHLSYRYFEKPILRFKDRFRSDLPHVSPVPASAEPASAYVNEKVMPSQAA